MSRRKHGLDRPCHEHELDMPRCEQGLENPRQIRPHGNAIDHPGNPRHRPRFVEKHAVLTDDMEDRKELLTSRALLMIEEGPVGVVSREEVAEIIMHHFRFCKYELEVFRTQPEPFLVIFKDQHARDRVYARGRLEEGPYAFQFHSWPVDRHGPRVILPFYVKLHLEGIPHHASYVEVADEVLSDECVIHHVDEAARLRLTQKLFTCWVFCTSLLSAFLYQSNHREGHD